MHRRSLLTRILLLATAASGLHLSAHASNDADKYPERPVTVISPFPAGGTGDRVARTVAASLQSAIGQTFVVENRTGAGGAIGAEAIVRAAGDPHTLFVGSVGPMSVNPHLYRSLRYDPVKDFVPISMLISMPQILVVNTNSPFKTFQDLVTHAEANPGKLTYGSAGNGTAEHTNAAMLASMKNLSFVHVPYKGAAPSITDLMGGSLDFIVEQSVLVLPMIRGGRLRALAVTTAQRSPLLPDVPTFAESGVPGYEASSWFALYAPANTSAAIQSKLNNALKNTFGSEKTKQEFAEIGAEIRLSTPDELAAIQSAESVKWGKIVREASINVD